MNIRDQMKPNIRWKADALLRQKRLTEASTSDAPNRVLLEQTRILRDVVDYRVLANEPEMAEARWTKYGYKSAFEATEEFTRLYVKRYESYRRQYVDSSPHVGPVNAEFVLNDPGTMNALYCARQFADALGLPYDRFITGMFGRLMGVGRYRRVPMPNHLFPPISPRRRNDRKAWVSISGETVAPKALRHGLNVQEQDLPKARVMEHDWDPRFQARNYVGDPAQDRALKALAEHREADTTPKSRLRDRLEKGWISVDLAKRVFLEDTVDAAVRAASKIPGLSSPDKDLTPYWPHCLGLVQLDVAAPQCASCPWVEKCRTLATYAEQQQMELTGYANRRDRERQATLERKRKQRRKDSAGTKE